jgi:8-oxo-dGTP diphosphatase
VQWLLNRDIELARALGVGVHLGSEQLLALPQRPLPEGQLVAASCHDLQQLQAAQQLGCDFAVLGPVQATASHPEAVPLGWEAFADCARRCHADLRAGWPGPRPHRRSAPPWRAGHRCHSRAVAGVTPHAGQIRAAGL